MGTRSATLVWRVFTERLNTSWRLWEYFTRTGNASTAIQNGSDINIILSKQVVVKITSISLAPKIWIWINWTRQWINRIFLRLRINKWVKRITQSINIRWLNKIKLSKVVLIYRSETKIWLQNLKWWRNKRRTMMLQRIIILQMIILSGRIITLPNIRLFNQLQTLRCLISIHPV